MIGKGVRFNAEKKAIGAYFTTKIWAFTMRAPCCQNRIEIHTDPKNARYIIVEGAREKVSGFVVWKAAHVSKAPLFTEHDQAMLLHACRRPIRSAQCNRIGSFGHSFWTPIPTKVHTNSRHLLGQMPS